MTKIKDKNRDRSSVALEIVVENNAQETGNYKVSLVLLSQEARANTTMYPGRRPKKNKH